MHACLGIFWRLEWYCLDCLLFYLVLHIITTFTVWLTSYSSRLRMLMIHWTLLPPPQKKCIILKTMTISVVCFVTDFFCTVGSWMKVHIIFSLILLKSYYLILSFYRWFWVYSKHLVGQAWSQWWQIGLEKVEGASLWAFGILTQVLETSWDLW